ncbi:MAG: hypothetical protein LBL92_03650, partial [Propionibacteriaceae bacterium]|nr:hypothetical protein [Propionibacteriaceae bacterium]
MAKPEVRVTRYECGYCSCHLNQVFAGQPRQRHIFQSNAFLIEHPTRGRLLFDTGYSHKLFQSGPIA